MIIYKNIILFSLFYWDLTWGRPISGFSSLAWSCWSQTGFYQEKMLLYFDYQVLLAVSSCSTLLLILFPIMSKMNITSFWLVTESSKLSWIEFLLDVVCFGFLASQYRNSISIITSVLLNVGKPQVLIEEGQPKPKMRFICKWVWPFLKVFKNNWLKNSTHFFNLFWRLIWTLRLYYLLLSFWQTTNR